MCSPSGCHASPCPLEGSTAPDVVCSSPLQWQGEALGAALCSGGSGAHGPQTTVHAEGEVWLGTKQPRNVLQEDEWHPCHLQPLSAFYPEPSQVPRVMAEQQVDTGCSSAELVPTGCCSMLPALCPHRFITPSQGAPHSLAPSGLAM